MAYSAFAAYTSTFGRIYTGNETSSRKAARSGRRPTATGSGTKGLVMTAPQGYTGHGGALRLKEDIVAKLDDLVANGAGRMGMTGSGIAAQIPKQSHREELHQNHHKSQRLPA